MSRDTDPHDPCAGDASGTPGCGTAPLERLQFWNGRFLVARNLRHQQDDLIRRQEYHQRFAHGEGILCGFGIRRHPRDECERDWLVVEPGMAYDCCGRTLWMPEAAAVRIPRRAGQPGTDPSPGGPRTSPAPRADAETGPWELPDTARKKRPGEGDGPGGPGGSGGDGPGDGGDGPGNGGGNGPGNGGNGPGNGGGNGPGNGPGGPGPNPPDRLPEPEYFIAARRVECPTDPQPALYADDLCEPVRHQNGRIREDVELRVLRATEVSQECWPRWRDVTDRDCAEDFEDDCRGSRGDTVPCDHGCGCGDEWVILAGVWRDAQGRLRWDLSRRKVLTPPAALTRITGVNWPHGGEVGRGQLEREMEGRLVVRFSRRLRPAQGFARGINPMTFTVSYLGQSGAWEEVLGSEPGDRGGDLTPTLSENGRCAVFTIPPDLLAGRRSIAGTWVRVRLLGDFILDCHGRAVSAAHTGGDVNGRGTGNGVPGGTFESWFYVREDNR